MKRFYLILVLAAVSFGCSRGSFTFVQMSDPQIGFIDPSPTLVHSDTLYRKAVEAVNGLSPSLVIITGDLVNNPESSVQDSIFRKRTSEIVAPVHFIPGNHDIMGYSESTHDRYLSMRGYDRFSFTYKGCAFIGFDSNPVKDGDKEAEEEILSWLKKELAKAKRCRYRFLFMHHPIIMESYDEKDQSSNNFPQPKRDEYISLLKQYHVDAVFCGHTHVNHACRYDGIGFYTAGPVGSPKGTGYSGYNVVEVSEDSISVNYTATPGVTKRPLRGIPPRMRN